MEIGATIGDYRVEEVIASGGFGTVYRASEISTGHIVALKVLHDHLSSSREAVTRFQREVRMVNLIDHPNVVDIFTFGQLPTGQPYFTMELLAGRTVRAHIRKHGRMTPDEVLEILEPLCSGLAAAHAKGIVHRDLKASNVFLDERAAARRVVLLDFGVAKLLDDTGPALTASRHVVGTPPCMAPEQICGEHVDERTDVYALGVLAFQMLTGTLPFVHKHSAIVQDMHLHQPAPLPSRRAPLPASVDEVVCRALAKEPDDRWDCVQDMLGAFRCAVAAERASKVVPVRSAGLCVGLHVDVSVQPEALEHIEDELLDAIENLLPSAARALADHDLRPAMQSGNSMLLLGALPDDADESWRRCAILSNVAEGLYSELRDLVSDDPRVLVSLCIDVGEERDLLRLSTWLPDTAIPGVHVFHPCVTRTRVAG